MSHQVLPNEAVDLSFAKHGYGRRLEYQLITSELKEPLLLSPNQVWKRAQLEAVNDEALAFVDLIGATIANVSFKGGLDFLRCGFPEVVRSKFRAIGAHECNAHVSFGLVHDPSERIGSQGRVD